VAESPPREALVLEQRLQESMRQLEQRLQKSMRQVVRAAAIETATALLVLTPDDATGYRLRGVAYDEIGNRTEALQDMRRAADLGDLEARRILHTWQQATP
jgi:Flp pilus assembly protein TadD